MTSKATRAREAHAGYNAGARRTRTAYLGLLIGTYTVLGVGVALRVLPPLALLVALTLPQAFHTWRIVNDETNPAILTRSGLRGTARLHQRFGLLLTVAFLLSGLRR